MVPCGMHGQNDSTYEPAAILRRDEAVQRQRTSWCICNLRLGIASGNCDSDDSDTTLKSARRIKLGYETFGLYPIVSLAFKIQALNSSSRTSASDEVLICEFEMYVCRQVLFIGCGWSFNLHKQSACSGEQPANWSAGCAKVAYIWQQNIPAALDRR